ncbi:MAG TPA: hypothetical protein DEO70_02095 [Bacteroidales bacterium]|nr:MAG: hypothetical protein A2X11_12885 [Bacteroidetes bacterium GWE2_42_24]OFY28938.1 MAG: hypothetical protein A2X09_16995 [Bacteroidetes bacterium GWF2_43_11]HBZ65600.1 hypothetical protein [Bacteroidales bacterium]
MAVGNRINTTMRKTIISIVIIISIFCCKKEDKTEPVHYLKNCATEYLNFFDDNKYFNNSSLTFPAKVVSKTIVSLQYSGNRVVRATGGFMNAPAGNNFMNLMFFNDVYDSIVYVDNSIYVYTRPDVFYSSVGDDPEKPTVYIKDAYGRLIKTVRRDGTEFNYKYHVNQIVEESSNGEILRNFYFKDNNLVRITRESGDTSSLYYSKKEMLFQEYDTKPNPLKNMYHLTGAFYRSFSENNYSQFTVNEYRHLDNGKIGIVNTSWYSIPIVYNAFGYPKFGEYAE